MTTDSSSSFWILNDRVPKNVHILEFVEWSKANPDGKLLALTRLGEGHFVSTVFLFVDHSHGNGPPVLFETMVFGGLMDRECVRYTTYDDALNGHARMVERVRACRP